MRSPCLLPYLVLPREPEWTNTARRSDRRGPARPVVIAELALQQLPAGVARQLADEVDGPGPLHLGQPAFEGGEDLGRELVRRLDAVGRLDDRLDLLAPLLVRDAEDGYVGDLGVDDDLGLYLSRVDVRPAGDDHVRLAVTQEQEAVGVKESDVADGEVAVQPARRRLLGIPLVLELQAHFHINGAGHTGQALLA